MSKKIYRKDILQSITSSKGRFFSILSLMMIGAMALIALKVTSPNMQKAADLYVQAQKMTDLVVMSDMGLSKDDVKELDSIKGAKVEYGYLTDVTIKDTHDAVRIFSKTPTISQYKLVSGQMPKTDKEIALSENLANTYKLGQKISFKQADKGILKTVEFTIAGFVHSAEIWGKDSMGSTRAGTGDLTGYAVTEADAFHSEVYLMARLRYKDLEGLAYHSKEYEEKIIAHQKELDKLLEDNGVKRLSSIRAEGQKKIDQGQKEIQDSEKKLAAAEQKITDGQKQIDSGKSQLDAAQSQVVNGQADLAISKQALENAKQQLDNLSNLLATARKDLDAAQSQLAKRKTQLDDSKKQLGQTKQTLDAKKTELDQAAAQIQAAQLTVQTALKALEAKIAALKSQGKDPEQDPTVQAERERIFQEEEKIKVAQETYNKSFEVYQAGFNQYQEGLKRFEAGQAAYQAGVKQLNEGEAQYQAGMAQYQTLLQTYEAGLAKYQAGQGQINDAQAQLNEKTADLTKAIDQLDASKADFATKKKEVQDKIAKAKKDLEKAKADLDNLEEPVYTSYTRSTLPGGGGYETYRTVTDNISAVGNAFPVVLYLVAAMVTFMTMTRFVDEERTQAGIFKALGYSHHDIIFKFVNYGFIASMLGTFLGILLGNFYLSPMIERIIADNMTIGQSQLQFYPSWTALSILLGLISAVLPAYLVARKELGEQPAQLLQAKPPVAGATILLEKITFLWKRMSFTQKVTARNIFRYKQRMLMTVFGVAGTVALLFGGLGIRSSISGIRDVQFGQLLRYDMIVVQSEKASENEKKLITDKLHSQAIDKQLSLYTEGLEEKIAGFDEVQNISLFVTANPEEFSQFISLRQRGNQTHLELTDEGIILSEKLAQAYGVKKGDSISLTLNEKPVKLKVSGISEMYAGHFIYMTSAYYEKVTGKVPILNSNMIRSKKTSDSAIQELAAEFLEMKGVAAVSQNMGIIARLTTVIRSLESIMLILTILSILLGVVILYNLTSINVAERIRELSTIKVLGFHNREVTLYIYRETIILSLLGIGLGLLGGIGLHKVLLNLLGSPGIMFNPTAPLSIYLTPVIAVTSILLVLGWFVNYKLRKVDMLEALKSVE